VSYLGFPFKLQACIEDVIFLSGKYFISINLSHLINFNFNLIQLVTRYCDGEREIP
jgi:hypothetical protein